MKIKDSLKLDIGVTVLILTLATIAYHILAV